MSPKNISISPTANRATTDEWLPTEVFEAAQKRETTTFQVEPSAMVISERRSATIAATGNISVSIEPANVLKRQVIRKMNEELEGRTSSQDTFASKTAR